MAHFVKDFTANRLRCCNLLRDGLLRCICDMYGFKRKHSSQSWVVRKRTVSLNDSKHMVKINYPCGWCQRVNCSCLHERAETVTVSGCFSGTASFVLYLNGMMPGFESFLYYFPEVSNTLMSPSATLYDKTAWNKVWGRVRGRVSPCRSVLVSISLLCHGVLPSACWEFPR